MAGAAPRDPPWLLPELAAAAIATAPHELGGVVLRARPGPVREAWLTMLRELLPADTALRRVPAHVSEARLVGGLDLPATLRSGHPVLQQGLLADGDGDLLLLAMAERASATTVAHLAAVLDRGEVLLEREGLSGRSVSRPGVVALDEGLDADEHTSPVLGDRLAIHLDLDALSIRAVDEVHFDARDIDDARRALPAVTTDAAEIEALCKAACALGIDSVRGPQLALKLARVLAALAGRDAVDDQDLQRSTQLCLLPRATRLPAPPEPDRDEQPPPPEPPAETQDGNEDSEQQVEPEQLGAMQELLLEAALASLPPDLLLRLRRTQGLRRRAGAAGKSGARQRSRQRGRPVGAVRGDPRNGARLNLVDTLRAAAPWQPLRRRHGESERVQVRPDDFRVTRYRQRAETTILFVVDASGSAALHRLAESKGAVELLLADCYVRRDSVALIAFRGDGADVLLPPTRSLVRAKRSLAALPGGGGTPLSAALDAAALLAEQVQRRGATPYLVLLTDGRANVCRDGSTGRDAALEEALQAARQLRALDVAAIVIDTSRRPHPNAEQLAARLGAEYQPLPHADAQSLNRAVRDARPKTAGTAS